MKNELTVGIVREYRPCLVDGKKALFHRWAVRKQIVEPSIRVGGHRGGEVEVIVAIVEYENGKVAECYPIQVRFCDRMMEEYLFEMEEQNG